VISTRAQENFTGARVVKAFAREAHEIERFDTENDIFLERRIKVIAGFAEFFPTMTAIVTATIGIVLWVGGRMVLSGEMSVGTLVGFTFWVLMLAQPTQNLGFLVNRGAEAIAAARRLFEVLDAPRLLVPPAQPVPLGTPEGRVQFENVSFGYDPKRPVLHEIDLDVGPDRIVALFGATGSGKTSLVSLISRFYDATSGRVLVDGHDVRDLSLTELRRHVGFVRQDSFLFSSTIRENIAYGLQGRPRVDGDAGEEPVEEALLVAAAKAAQAHDFITALPAGYDTLVGERGVTLSGGQRQRIALARALVTRPRILVLDDALNAVDTETEARIQRSLTAWMRGRTTFVIAQRLLSLKHADQVIVLDDGRIVERGSHDELVRAGGRYQRVYELQLREQEEAAELAASEVTR
jgi:ATP-binding cassette subfamily B protein